MELARTSLSAVVRPPPTHPLLRVFARRALPGVCLGALLLLSAHPAAQGGGLLQELYFDIPGSAVSDLLDHPKYPGSPDQTNVLQVFEGPTDAFDNYGQRLRGFLVPPLTGNYTFWIASDDNSVLYLSDDTDPLNKVDIATVPGWTNPREWDRYPSQESGLVYLESGQVYYVEALMKEGGGGDNLAVRWRLPNATIEEPIPESRLLPYGTAFSAPLITVEPEDVTAAEGEPATFQVQVSNVDPIAYQWQRGGTNIPGATASRYTFADPRLTDSGAFFRCRLTNSLGQTFTRSARLEVIPDQRPPTIDSVQNFGRQRVNVVFSETMERLSATNLAHYTIDQGVQVAAANLEADLRTVQLQTSDLTYGTTYTLHIQNVRDRASQPNTIAPGTHVTFTVVEYLSGEIGVPSPPGTSEPVPGGLEIGGGGAGIGDKTDQLHFSYRLRTGDFDVRVRIESLQLTDPWALAGLMARATLEAGSPYVAVLATPGISGISGYSRITNSLTVRDGLFPVNYPWTWLRLQRTGNSFRAQAGFDGTRWFPVAAFTNSLPSTVHLGMAVSSRIPGQIARARFLELGEVLESAAGAWPERYEPLGPSSRRTGIVFSEIHYHPGTRTDGRNLEFIELFNSMPTPEDLSGLRLDGSVQFTFPADTTLPAGGFVVVAKSPADLAAVYGLPGVLGEYDDDLPNDNGTVQLRDPFGGVLLEVNYRDRDPWPIAADGSGHSLVLARPSYGEGEAAAWAASRLRGGSPGTFEAIQPDPLDVVRINEFLAHTDPPLEDYVELYNPSTVPISLAGASLSDDPVVPRLVFGPDTVLPPRGFLALTGAELGGFNLRASGEELFLVNADQTRVVDAVRFEAQANGIASGRFPDGGPAFQPLVEHTPGLPNARPRIPEVVINEIMYHPATGEDDEYVELHNRATNSISLAYWRLIDGIDFIFPTNAVIPAGGYVVVARNAARLLANHPSLTPAITFGNFEGQLADGGERIALGRPLEPTTPYQDYVVVDEVTYGDGGRWGRWSDGGGSSLELTDPRADNRLAANWADSLESAKAPWTKIESAGVLEWGTDVYGVNTLQVLMMGEGECLLDNVQVIDASGNNLVVNGTFEDGTRYWTMSGTHIRSDWETGEGSASQHSLHIRASARGGTDANQVRVDLLKSLAPGTAATLRADVRWLTGNPEILLRLRGNYLETAGRMTLPQNLGTPGARNSRDLTNAAPAIFDVRHDPILPALNQSVRVTARIDDPDGIRFAQLTYRVGPALETVNVPMTDDGTGGDLVPRDGIYTARIPGQPTTNLVAFKIQASDQHPILRTREFPGPASPGGCLVRWGEPILPGNLGVYRLWITKSTLDTWAGRHPSSNDPLDGTFVYGQYRAIYNMGALYSGSPFHWTGYDSPLGSPCNYVLVFPSDDRLLGATDYVLNLPANLGSDRTAQREQLFYSWVRETRRPYTYRRFCHFFLNGAQRGFVFEDVQQPNRDFVAQWFPDDPDGELYKIEDWFEYYFHPQGGVSFQNVDATLDDFVGADGSKQLERYRWNFRKRAVRDSAHDYANLFALVDALNTPESDLYTRQVETLVDVEAWMKTFALRHVVGDWDAYGYRRGKNMYLYKPTRGQWQLLDWDVAFAFGLGDGATHDLFDAAHSDGTIDRVSERMYQHPPFRRAYLRALHQVANGPMLPERVGPRIDQRAGALKATGVGVTGADSIKSWIESRRKYILGVLTNYTTPFALTNNDGRAFTVSGQNLVTLGGRAPVHLRTLRVNGTVYPVTWSTETNWTLRLPLATGLNTLRVQGFDSQDRLDPAAGATISVTFAGTVPAPQAHIVINEIMYHPAAPDTGYVEIHNTSSASTFDLSGWRLRGADFTFPDGAIIEPGAYLVVVNNRAAFTALYGNRVPIAGEFQGRLRNDGEMLSLVIPGAAPTTDVVIDQVEYDELAPWPALADGQGPSLQLVDPNLDNRRVGNWAAVSGLPGSSAGWRFASITGVGHKGDLYLYLASAGDVYLDDLSMVAGTTPAAGTNLLKNGGFESGTASWTVSASAPNTAVTTNLARSGAASLHLVASSEGNLLQPNLAQKVTSIINGGTYTLSFWYAPGLSGGGLTVGLLSTDLLYNDLETTVALLPGETPLAPATPGAANSVRSILDPFPELWINEVLPLNLQGAQDRMGDRDPWIELLNAGATEVSLAGCHLSGDPADPTRWSFPANTVIPAGGRLLIWADGEPAESSETEFHTNFRLDPASGVVVLACQNGVQTLVLDHVSYDNLPADRSLGSFPEADPYQRMVFQTATPGQPNSNVVQPVPVRINEWMASNQSTIRDPADGDFNDWFELYNPNDIAVDLSAYTLTDDLSWPGQWILPMGTVMPGRGFLLIWADGEPGQTGPLTGLHANFRLSQGGEAIGLYAPDGRLVDAVVFGQQITDVSQGLFPDGGSGAPVFLTQSSPEAPNIAAAQLRLTATLIAGGVLSIECEAEAGAVYQLQYKDDLIEAEWQVLTQTVAPAGIPLRFDDPAPLTQPLRYYRVLRLP